MKRKPQCTRGPGNSFSSATVRTTAVTSVAPRGANALLANQGDARCEKRVELASGFAFAAAFVSHSHRRARLGGAMIDQLETVAHHNPCTLFRVCPSPAAADKRGKADASFGVESAQAANHRSAGAIPVPGGTQPAKRRFVNRVPRRRSMGRGSGRRSEVGMDGANAERGTGSAEWSRGSKPKRATAPKVAEWERKSWQWNGRTKQGTVAGTGRAELQMASRKRERDVGMGRGDNFPVEETVKIPGICVRSLGHSRRVEQHEAHGSLTTSAT